MRRIIKKTFIPHSKNNPRPLFWHPLSIGFFVFALCLLSGVVTFQKEEIIKNNSLLGDIKSGAIIAFTNKERTKIGVSTLIESNTLTHAATLKAQDMAQESYFAHYSPSGISPWFWFTKAGYEYQKAGENLAVNFKDSKEVVHAWMNSPTHKANIIKDGYSEIGIGTAEGVYKDKNVTFVVQLFAAPKEKSLSDTLALAIEKKTPIISDQQTSVRGAEVEILSTANMLEVLSSQKHLPVILLSILSFVIIFAILTVCIKWKYHNKKFYFSIIVLGLTLLISLYTLINFFNEVSVVFYK